MSRWICKEFNLLFQPWYWHISWRSYISALFIQSCLRGHECVSLRITQPHCHSLCVCVFMCVCSCLSWARPSINLLTLLHSVSLGVPADFSDILIPCFLIVLLFPLFHIITSPPPPLRSLTPHSLKHPPPPLPPLSSSLPIISSADSHIRLSPLAPVFPIFFAPLCSRTLSSFTLSALFLSTFPFISFSPALSSPWFSSDSYQFKSLPCPPTSSVWQIRPGWEQLRLEQAQPAPCCPEERTEKAVLRRGLIK